MFSSISWFKHNRYHFNSAFNFTSILPKLVVHVGVSSLATGLTLEQEAHKSGYCRSDIKGKLPPGNEASCGKTEVIRPLFDLEDVCKEVGNTKIGIPTFCSSNAGR
jgi:pyroglutamyl-peptidase